MSKIPTITHLQFAILSKLFHTKTGNEIRTELLYAGIATEGPKFYQMMSRLEKKKLVKGYYRKRIVNRQIIRERIYYLSEAGFKTVQEIIKFYSK